MLDVQSVREYLPTNSGYEAIWVREANAELAQPTGFLSIGFEPTWFPGEFSALCDCMFLPRWHGADPDSLDLIGHFEKLNRNGLFDIPADAEKFLKHYLTFEWAEQPMSDECNEIGNYVTVEVFELAER